jgi:hypothetical protein
MKASFDMLIVVFLLVTKRTKLNTSPLVAQEIRSVSAILNC